MLNNKEKYRVKAMCRTLKISESGYYRWLKNREKSTARALLSVKIQEILDEHPDNDNYGVKRMNTALEVLNEDSRPIVHSDRGCHYRWLGW